MTNFLQKKRRLKNLFKITSKNSQVVPFITTTAQDIVADRLKTLRQSASGKRIQLLILK